MGHVYKFLVLCLTVSVTNGQLTTYIHSVASFLGYGQEPQELAQGFEQKIPYEVSVADEKFISQAIQLTGVALSELDTCQHRVILKLKSDCYNMNDETLSKIAVMLLNCQSYAEGRQLFPCNDQMSIKDCTSSMNGDTWNSYHLMSNRVRAVCYSIRQVQFRGMTEHTINRLMDTAKQQVVTLEKINYDQEKLQQIAQGTLKTVMDGHAELAEQQADLRKAQLFGQLSIEDNIKRLANEKQLIIESQDQLAMMTKGLQEKLEEASEQIEHQAQETDDKHRELLEDLISIKDKAQVIFQRIGESTELLIKQTDLAQEQYEATLKQLTELNSTVSSLVNLVGGTKQAMEERLTWLTEALGGTDDAVERMYVILWHLVFLMFVMIACAFLGARTSTRVMVVTLVPCNLILSLYKFEQAVDALTLGITLTILVAVQTTTLWIISVTTKNKFKLSSSSPKRLSPIKEHVAPIKQQVNHSDDRYSRSSTPINPSQNEISYTHSKSSVRDRFEDSYSYTERTDDDYASPTPPLSRSGYYSSRSRSRTPMTLNSSMKSSCQANTRVGTPCKLSSMPGRDYCYRHQKGDSVIG